MAKKNNLKLIKIPKKNEKLSEFVGVILGDGNITKLYNPDKKVATYQVRIAGNSIKDYNYIVNYLKPLAENLFGIKTGIHKVKDCNGMYLTLTGKNIVNFFIKIGLKAGDKIKNNIGIPSWIKKDKRFLRACLRGLIDTDGCLYELRPHWPGLFQLNFKNFDKKLLSDTRDSLLNLGFKVSRITSNKIYITRKAEIHKFYKEIGSSNDRLLQKHQEFLQYNSPVV